MLHKESIASKMADVDKWIEIAKQCKYLPENDLKVNLNFSNLDILFKCSMGIELL